MDLRFVKTNEGSAEFSRGDVNIQQDVEHSLLAPREVFEAEVPLAVSSEVERPFLGWIPDSCESQMWEHPSNRVPDDGELCADVSKVLRGILTLQIRQNRQELRHQALIVLSKSRVRLSHPADSRPRS